MIEYLYLRRMGYAEALELQREVVELRYEGRVDNTLLLLEHEPVLTLGRNADRSNILATDVMLAQRGISVHDINRGGDVTYHGPGQLVGYPIFDLRSMSNGSGGRLGPVDFVRRIEETLIRLCAGYGVVTGRVAGRTGVWTQSTAAGVDEKKIGAIGIHVSRGITSHGFAFNLTTDLRDFQWIVPCGIADRAVTSLELEMSTGRPVPSLEEAADAAARCFGQIFGEPVLALENLAALRSGEREVGTPMRRPAEVERLAGEVTTPATDTAVSS
jgi:lipoyl(octanoyl) transferase